MKEKFNLVEILKNAPRGLKLYSPIFGECELVTTLEPGLFPIRVQGKNYEDYYGFTKNGYYLADEDSECLLFPSKYNRDWSTFKLEEDSIKIGDHIMREKTKEVYYVTRVKPSGEGFWIREIHCTENIYEIYVSVDEFGQFKRVDKFDRSWFKSFDRVLVRDSAKSNWFATLFSHIKEGGRDYPYYTSIGCYQYCIPYNAETECLVGTRKEEPEFYKN